MKFFTRAWEDIVRGENIDLYLTVLVAIILTFLNVLGIAPNTWGPSMTIAILGLLAISTLSNRYKIEETLERFSAAHKEELFSKNFPESLSMDFEGAEELWIFGVNLGRTVTTYFPVLERKLKQGGKVNVLLINPDGPACQITAMRMYRGSDYSTQNHALIQTSLSSLRDLSKIAPKQLEVRLTDYPLSFGGFAFDPNSVNGVLYLKHYPFKTPGGANPKLTLRPKDGHWYEQFKDEVFLIWDNANIWSDEERE